MMLVASMTSMPSIVERAWQRYVSVKVLEKKHYEMKLMQSMRIS